MSLGIIPLIPLIAGTALIGGGFWLKSENTEQERIRLEQMKLTRQDPAADWRARNWQPPGTPASLEDYALPAALALVVAAGVVILKRK